MLGEYEKVHPGAAEMFFDLLKEESRREGLREERQFELAESDLRARNRARATGQWLTFAVVVLVIGLAAVAVVLGLELAGAAIGVAGVGGMSTLAFRIVGVSRGSKTSSDKDTLEPPDDVR